MAARVRQRLLHDPVDGAAQLRRHVGVHGDVGAELGRYPRLPRRLHEAADVDDVVDRARETYPNLPVTHVVVEHAEVPA